MIDFLDALFAGSQLEILRATARWGVINTSVWSLGVVLASVSIFLARRTIRNAATAHVYGRIMDHNKMIYDDPKKQSVVDIFHKLSNVQRHNDIYPESDMYWAARSVYLSQVNIIAQAWILSGGSQRRFKKRFPGWIDLARATAKELSNATNLDRPVWYKEACSDIYPLSKDFGEKFTNWFNRLS